MMYPYLTLNDDTEITHSEMYPNGKVKVYYIQKHLMEMVGFMMQLAGFLIILGKFMDILKQK